MCHEGEIYDVDVFYKIQDQEQTFLLERQVIIIIEYRPTG